MNEIIRQLQIAFRYGIQKLIQNESLAYWRFKKNLRENPLCIFIAYDHKDRDKMYGMLHDKLEKEKCFKLKLWLDAKSDVKDATDEATFGPVVQNELAKTDCVIVCHTKTSKHNKGYLKSKELPAIEREAGKQRELSIYAILVKLEECATPKKYQSWPVAELHIDGGYKILAETIIRNAYEELKLKRGLNYESPLLNNKFW